MTIYDINSIGILHSKNGNETHKIYFIKAQNGKSIRILKIAIFNNNIGETKIWGFVKYIPANIDIYFPINLKLFVCDKKISIVDYMNIFNLYIDMENDQISVISNIEYKDAIFTLV